MNYFPELENLGFVVVGREIKSRFDTATALRGTADTIMKWAKKNKRKLKKLQVSPDFVYCGTTINWPELFEYPCLLGTVTYVYGELNGEPDPIPAGVFTERPAMEPLWTFAETLGLELSDADYTYVAVGGWTTMDIRTVEGEVLLQLDGYSCLKRIDDNDRLMHVDSLVMRADVA